MGSAQETFEEILRYLHRDQVYPQYTKLHKDSIPERQVELEDIMDEYGCNPKCPAHSTFGFQFCQLL
jgi:hypothetical protein